MKTYLADTNIFLRFILKDDEELFGKAEGYFLEARNGKIEIILVSEVVLEVNHVLRSFYSVERGRVAGILLILVQSQDLKVEEQGVWVETLEAYEKVNVGLVDLFLYFKAQKQKAEVLSFDKDFRRIKRMV